jgi:hypothetical protein
MPEQVLSCTDSPLAVTSSAITFLTLAYAIAATLYIYPSRLSASPHEIDKLFLSAQSHYHRLKLIGPDIRALETSSVKIDTNLRDLLLSRIAEVTRAFAELEGALSWTLGTEGTLPVNRRHYWKQSGRFVLGTGVLKNKVERLETGVKEAFGLLDFVMQRLACYIFCPFG